MSRTRSTRFAGIFIALGLAFSFALAAPGFAEEAKNDCKVAKDDSSDVGKACKEGGIKRAKAVMKAMVKQAKKAGMKTDCDSCHKDEENWELTSDGKDKFKEMVTKLAAAK